MFDCLVTAEAMQAAWKLFQEHRGEGLPVTAVIYSHSHGDHWGGVRGLVDEADVRFEIMPGTRGKEEVLHANPYEAVPGKTIPE